MAAQLIHPELKARLLAGKSDPNRTARLSAMDIHQLQQGIRRLCIEEHLEPDPTELAFWENVVEVPFLYNLIRKVVPQLDVYESVYTSVKRL